ncbi:PREDICTED: uncharacterized protein KIAA0825 [Condylura cristata]|uniref:uncharacterized protein KIAA0825 n=1 Tax=Condylura cristata TaxID=143302 RepID=UPI0006434CEA|nr:PREDICTED: uncharacterized protein KIAA0825 [Condylura cristata]
MESELEVIRCLRLVLTDAVKDIVQHIISLMGSGRSCETNLSKHNIPECLLESIPKEWNYIPKEAKRKDSSKGAFLDRWSKEKLGLICECLKSIVGDQTSSPNQMTHKVTQNIEQQKPNWIECQLSKARKLSTECAFMAREKSTASEEGDTALELTEQKINMMVLDICHKPGGSEYLRQIYHIMRLNEEYLKEQLFSMSGSEGKLLPIRPLNMTLRSVEDQPSSFNPFHVYKVFSENMLDQSAITKWNWNWSDLLPNYLGLDKMTFSVLLKNRWEMKKDETLEEEEKTMLEHLKRIYTTQNTSASDNTEEQSSSVNSNSFILGNNHM